MRSTLISPPSCAAALSISRPGQLCSAADDASHGCSRCLRRDSPYEDLQVSEFSGCPLYFGRIPPIGAIFYKPTAHKVTSSRSNLPVRCLCCGGHLSFFIILYHIISGVIYTHHIIICTYVCIYIYIHIYIYICIHQPLQCKVLIESNPETTMHKRIVIVTCRRMTSVAARATGSEADQGLGPGPQDFKVFV